MRCRICDLVSKIRHSTVRQKWYDDPICRKCTYLLEIFSFSGNRLIEYIDPEEFSLKSKVINKAIIIEC